MKLNLELPEQHPSASLIRNYPESEYISTYNGVTFLYTHNPSLIQKFIDLRSELYNKDPKFVGFRDFQHNEISDYCGSHQITQVLMDGDRCIGGGMLTFSFKEEPHPLPLEIDLNVNKASNLYILKNMLPELGLGDVNYMEASRMMVHPDHRKDASYIAKMFTNFYHKGIDLNMRYFFAMTDKPRCRMYRKIGAVHMHRMARILDHLTLPDSPEFEGVKMQIMVWDYEEKMLAAGGTIQGKEAL